MTELLTLAQVSEAYGFSPSTLRFWRYNSTGPASCRIGRRVLYQRHEVEAWISAQFEAAAQGGGR